MLSFANKVAKVHLFFVPSTKDVTIYILIYIYRELIDLYRYHLPVCTNIILFTGKQDDSTPMQIYRLWNQTESSLQPMSIKRQLNLRRRKTKRNRRTGVMQNMFQMALLMLTMLAFGTLVTTLIMKRMRSNGQKTDASIILNNIGSKTDRSYTQETIAHF